MRLNTPGLPELWKDGGIPSVARRGPVRNQMTTIGQHSTEAPRLVCVADRPQDTPPDCRHQKGPRDGHYTGHVPSGPEYVAYLQEAGFVDAEYSWLLDNRLGQIEARKPG